MGLRKGTLASDPSVLEPRVSQLESQMTTVSDASKISQLLTHGLSVINGTYDGPADVEVQGRTLVSMGSSILQNGKQFLLADKKTKIRTLGSKTAQTQGVAKFVQNIPTTDTAKFVGKVQGSTVENPHISKATTNPALQSPSGTWITTDDSTPNYNNISTLDGGLRTVTANTSTSIPQHLFSFDIISEIERQIGRIPKDTLAGKLQWCKDNIAGLTFNWYGYGSGPNGNKATISGWLSGVNWYTGQNHMSGTVTKLTFQINPATNYIDSNGFSHFLAYADASDGVTASTINTDYVELVITLNASAQLDNRPILARVANFEGKVSGSTVEVPHVAKWFNAGLSTLALPSNANWAELVSADGYNGLPRLTKQDGVVVTAGNRVGSGDIAQQLFQFDIVQEIERQLGRIPKATLADKIQWAKDNIASLLCNWYGFGTGPNGNKASLVEWQLSGNSWSGASTNTTSSVSSISRLISTYLADRIDSNGFVHFLAYADPSDGVTASTINTDYVELIIELKPAAILHDPVVPLYQIDDTTEYGNILTTWAETEVLSRYPKVQGVQHLQNIYAIAEGENLIPPFTDPAWNIGSGKVIDDYTLEGTLPNSTAVQFGSITIPCLPNTQYTFSTPALTSQYYDINVYDATGATVQNNYGVRGTKTVTTPSNGAKIFIGPAANTTPGTYQFSQPMLTLGSTAKPFTPRNPSYLFATTKLGQIGTVKDVLYKNDGQWYVRKSVEKDVVLDGSLGWNFESDTTGYKIVNANLNVSININDANYLRFDGKRLKFTSSTGSITSGDYGYLNTTGTAKISIYDTDSGFGETYTPLGAEIQAYFYGWQAKTVDGTGKPTVWRSLGDGTDAPTQTLAYVSTTKAPNFTPYKLSYVLATPVVQTATVEGDIALNGLTQVEVGSGVIVREKVTPVIYSGVYRINSFIGSTNGIGILKYEADKIYNIYKNGVIDTKWALSPDGVTHNVNNNGRVSAYINQSDFDTTAEYTVSYLVYTGDLTRNRFTNNAIEFTTKYDSSLKSVVDNLVEKQSDLFTLGSVNVQAIAELYKRVKSLGG
jgi:hypothetical protein